MIRIVQSCFKDSETSSEHLKALSPFYENIRNHIKLKSLTNAAIANKHAFLFRICIVYTPL